MASQVIFIHEAARRLHKTDEETFSLLKQGAFAGDATAKFPTVDPVSLDQYIRNSRPKDQRPLIPSHAEEIAAKSEWSPKEEGVIRDCRDRYEAVAMYRIAFLESHRTDEAIGKHWWKMRNAEKKNGKTSGIGAWIISKIREFVGAFCL